MKPKLLIDGTSLLSPITGIGRYTNEISNILTMDPDFNTLFYYGYYSKKLIQTNAKLKMKDIKSILSKNQFVKKISRKILLFSNKIYAPYCDLYWQPNFIPQKEIKSKYIVTTIHDFSFELYKDFHPKERIEYFQKYFYKNIQKTDCIITGSNFTKKEIAEKLKFDQNKIKTIYHGIKHDVFKQRNDLQLDIDLPKKYILSVGSIEPRKNLTRLIKAYINLPSYILNEYKLVLVGFNGWKNKDIINLIDKNRKNIVYLGFMSDNNLSKIYNRASLFVFPSLYEGFGFPPLEAMACGTPVVCSNTSSIPEVCEDAVIYFNPYNIEEIKNKMQTVLNNNILQKNMIKQGLVRVKFFNWQKSALEHKKCFDKLINR